MVATQLIVHMFSLSIMVVIRIRRAYEGEGEDCYLVGSTDPHPQPPRLRRLSFARWLGLNFGEYYFRRCADVDFAQ